MRYLCSASGTAFRGSAERLYVRGPAPSVPARGDPGPWGASVGRELRHGQADEERANGCFGAAYAPLGGCGDLGAFGPASGSGRSTVLWRRLTQRDREHRGAQQLGPGRHGSGHSGYAGRHLSWLWCGTAIQRLCLLKRQHAGSGAAGQPALPAAQRSALAVDHPDPASRHPAAAPGSALFGPTRTVGRRRQAGADAHSPRSRTAGGHRTDPADQDCPGADH